ncbi:lysophospholipase catalytic domain-containing protein [Xylaria sp. CBS 124048]|nr:lysophospholipase catalytic domain-containing protein [Xylaria sp. CBS 124048]
MVHVLSAALPLSLILSSPVVLAAPLPPAPSYHEVARSLLSRAEPNSPSGNYGPMRGACPAEKPTIRAASSLSPSETEWLKKRRPNTIEPMKKFFGLANITDFDAAGYIQSYSNNFSAIPNIGISTSGGGDRAFFHGAGFIAAADARTPGATQPGGIGYLLQSTTYLAGLSGGAWLVGSIYANNFSTVPEMQNGSSGGLWGFSTTIFQGPLGDNPAEYLQRVVNQVDFKHDAGFNVSVGDYWGRVLSYEMINAPDGGPNYTFSSIAVTPEFAAGEMPMPIIVTDEREPNQTTIFLNSTVFEFNPWEMGSFDPALYGFAPLKYTGSNFDNGRIAGNSCVEGYDNFGFVFGSSSALFNEVIEAGNFSNMPQFDVISDVFIDVLESLDDDNDADLSEWEPNPFYHYNSETNKNAESGTLSLLDGGEDGENIPLQPLIQPPRNVDVIFAIDASGNTPFFYPNGSAMIATHNRSMMSVGNGTLFPSVPDANTFVNLGLNKRPTFFGCNTTEFPSGSHIPPMIVYVPLAPYSAFSNTSTFQAAYSNDERNAFIQNGFNVATMANGTIDSDWPSCVACAVLSRSLERTGTPVPASCTACFNKFCWNGTIDTTPVPEYNPTSILQVRPINVTLPIVPE